MAAPRPLLACDFSCRDSARKNSRASFAGIFPRRPRNGPSNELKRYTPSSRPPQRAWFHACAYVSLRRQEKSKLREQSEKNNKDSSLVDDRYAGFRPLLVPSTAIRALFVRERAFQTCQRALKEKTRASELQKVLPAISCRCSDPTRWWWRLQRLLSPASNQEVYDIDSILQDAEHQIQD